jgi:hypothetical protein
LCDFGLEGGVGDPVCEHGRCSRGAVWFFWCVGFGLLVHLRCLVGHLMLVCRFVLC